MSASPSPPDPLDRYSRQVRFPALGEAGQQNAPLGRAVIGGLIGATLATLFVLPSLFSMFQSRVTSASPSLDPTEVDAARE